jgi:hypothetical protein
MRRDRRSRLEIVTIGVNPNLQVTASAPEGGAQDLGLFIGPNSNATAPTMRQLFLLCAKRFNAHQRARLVGIRQYLTIGVNIESTNGAFYPLERPVVTPTWKFVDGNVLWGVRRIPPETHVLPNPSNMQGLAFEYSRTSALLFETVTGGGGGVLPFDPGITVTPPYGGQFPGNVLTPELGRFFDMRTDAWSRPIDVDVLIEGPCDIALMASVQQTNPSTRTPVPSTPTFVTTEGANPEDAFIQTYASATYMRIAGALIFEMEGWAPGGMPKTYLDPATGDRITRDTASTGGNEIRRSGYETSGCAEDLDGRGNPRRGGR